MLDVVVNFRRLNERDLLIQLEKIIKMANGEEELQPPICIVSSSNVGYVDVAERPVCLTLVKFILHGPVPRVGQVSIPLVLK